MMFGTMTSDSKTVWATAIIEVVDEKTFRADEVKYRNQCAHELMDELIKLGLVEIDTSECTVLCGCPNAEHEIWCRLKGVKPFAVRTRIRLPDRSV